MRKVDARQIKKIHTLVNRLGLNDGEYRFILAMNFDVESSKQLTYSEAERLIDFLEARAIEEGVWKAKRVKKYDELKHRHRFFATPKQLRLIESLWNQVSRAPAESRARALEKFLKNRGYAERLEMLSRDEARKVILALKAMQKQEVAK